MAARYPHRTPRLLAAAALVLLLAACGQKGALQLPDKPGEVVSTGSATPPQP